MIDYIKKQIAARNMSIGSEKTVTDNEFDNDNDVIIEYARLFQELDDISIEGTEQGKIRSLAIDIPVEDDVEIDTIEFNLSDGRVTDVPMDVAVQESYKYMKTYDEFYQEAKKQCSQLYRESNSSYYNRITKIADEFYSEYCDTIKKKGLFGHNKLSIYDNDVPSIIPVNIGKNKSLFTKMKVFFETDRNHKILKKQLDPISIIQENNVIGRMGEHLSSKFNTSEDIWEIVTPNKIYVPQTTGDNYCVIVEFTNDITGKCEYVGWNRTIKESSGIQNLHNEFDETSFTGYNNFENKALCVQEFTSRQKRPISRFYQEAIDFGDDDGGSDLPPVEESNDTESEETSTEEEVSVDTNDENAESESNESSDVDTNDVSKEIAQKVVDKTNEEETEDNSNVSFDDDDNSDLENDTTDSEYNNDEYSDSEDNSSIDDNLNDLDSNVDQDTEDSDESIEDLDFDNMTIDQLIEQGSEKLKGMTLQEIKDFIKSGDSNAIQEAFILTKKNINKEIDINIRKTLGVLNDNKMSVQQILKKFKSEGKKLNRVLSKAIKMKDVYKDNDNIELVKLNKYLIEFMTSIKSSGNQESNVIKDSAKAFNNQCGVVAKIVEKKMSSSSKPINDSTNTDDTNKVKNNKKEVE